MKYNPEYDTWQNDNYSYGSFATQCLYCQKAFATLFMRYLMFTAVQMNDLFVHHLFCHSMNALYFLAGGHVYRKLKTPKIKGGKQKIWQLSNHSQKLEFWKIFWKRGVRLALLFPACQTKWCAFKVICQVLPSFNIEEDTQEGTHSIDICEKEDWWKSLSDTSAGLALSRPVSDDRDGWHPISDPGAGDMAWDGPLSGLAGATPVIYSWLLSSAPLVCSSAKLTGWLTKYLYAGLYGTARAYSTSGTMALWAFSGPPVTLSIRCQTDAQPKKSRFESSPSFMYEGSFSLICRQIVLRPKLRWHI